jgi:hypothetical protein
MYVERALWRYPAAFARDNPADLFVITDDQKTRIEIVRNVFSAPAS